MAARFVRLVAGGYGRFPLDLVLSGHHGVKIDRLLFFFRGGDSQVLAGLNQTWNVDVNSLLRLGGRLD